MDCQSVSFLNLLDKTATVSVRLFGDFDDRFQRGLDLCLLHLSGWAHRHPREAIVHALKRVCKRGGHRWSLAERQQMLGQVSYALAADLLHDLTKLALEHDQGVITAPGSQGAHAIHEAAAHEDKLCP